MSGRPALGAVVLAAHGSRDPAAGKALAALARQVRERLAGRQVRLAYVDVGHPTLAEALPAATAPVSVVPLLLSAGYHLGVDVGPLAAAAGARVTAALGPDPLLDRALLDGLAAAGAPADTPVLLVATGSGEPAGRDGCARQAASLTSAGGRQVVAAYLTCAPYAADELARLRAGGRRVAVAPYLLAPGRFAAEVAELGGDWTAPVLAGHEAVVETVLRRLGCG